MRHFVIVGILVIVMAVLTYVGLDAAGFATQMNPVAALRHRQSIVCGTGKLLPCPSCLP